MPARTISPSPAATCESPGPPPDTGSPTARTTGFPSRSPYDYRHSLELSLKWLIRKAAQCALREGYAGEEDLGPDQSDKRLRTHDVRRLADCLDRYLALLDLPKVEQRIDPESWSQLNWLDSEDATGETYRYAVAGKRYLDWKLEDPAGQGVDAVRPIRDEIKTLVEGLIADIAPTKP